MKPYGSDLKMIARRPGRRTRGGMAHNWRRTLRAQRKCVRQLLSREIREAGVGVKSTITISRNAAISRIAHINNLAVSEDYRGIERITAESESIQLFVDGYTPHKMGSLRNWTNGMLADRMNKPFFRLSEHDNYIVVDEVG